jgi:hypothetical protein
MSGRPLEEKWTKISDAYRQKYTNLRERDVKYGIGLFDNMFERIGQPSGRDAREVRKGIEYWKS